MTLINIDGLQGLDKELQPGANYVLLASSEVQGICIARQTISNNHHSFLLSEDIERFLTDDEYLQFSVENMQQCQAFRITKPFLLGHKREFLKQAFSEISFYKNVENCHVVVHLSDDILIEISSDTLAQYLHQASDFAKKHNATLLTLLTGHQAKSLRVELATLNSIVAGIAYVDAQASNQRLVFDYWRCQQGYRAQISYQLHFFPALYVELLASNRDEIAGAEMKDADAVYVVQSLTPQNVKLPKNYHLMVSNEAIFQNEFGFYAATLVFAVDKNTRVEQLAQQCFLLRQQCGDWLKMVVINHDGMIRHQDECTLLTVGVNLIIPALPTLSRLMSQVESIQGVKFARQIPPSFEEVLIHVKGSNRRGYLPVYLFLDEIHRQRESAFNTGVSGVLVVLDVIEQLDVIHAVRLFNIKREGDILTATKNKVYLYFHACREHDVDSALQRVFRLSLGEFFSAHSVYAEDLYIDEQCRELRKFAMANDTQDLSEQLIEKDTEDLIAKPEKRRTEKVPKANINDRQPVRHTPLTLSKD